jgi:hypothetical protein
MGNIVKFNPVKVVKPFLSLQVGDELSVNPATGNYTFTRTSEDLGEYEYVYDKYNISLAPYIINRYKDFFITLDEEGKEIIDVDAVSKKIAEHKQAIEELEDKLKSK